MGFKASLEQRLLVDIELFVEVDLNGNGGDAIAGGELPMLDSIFRGAGEDLVAPLAFNLGYSSRGVNGGEDANGSGDVHALRHLRIDRGDTLDDGAVVSEEGRGAEKEKTERRVNEARGGALGRLDLRKTCAGKSSERGLQCVNHDETPSRERFVLASYRETSQRFSMEGWRKKTKVADEPYRVAANACCWSARSS
jgi:hypothetical protein